MRYLLTKSLDNITSLRHFYDIQKKYIDKKSKKGMRENSSGFLINYYFNVLTNEGDEEKEKSTFLALEKYVEKYITIKEITQKSVYYEIKNPEEFPVPDKNISNSAKEYRNFAEMPIVHGNNTLIMLITRFEEFVSDFIELLYREFPQKYLYNQSITFVEIANIGVEDVKEKIIAREIEKIMRDSFSSWFKLFEEHKMNFDECTKEYEILKELYARRNVLVHNSGIVNDSYIKSVTHSRYEIGEQLYADELYLNKAFEAIRTIIFCILIEGVRINKETATECIEDIFEKAFEELVAGNFNACNTIFYVLSKNPFADEITKHLAKVNYWIAKAEISGADSIKEEVQKFDVSALDKSFLMAKCVLLQKYDEANSVINELYDKKELPFYAIEKWPLFKGYRKSTAYSSFRDNHPELSGIITSETNKENNVTDDATRENIKTELNDNQDYIA